MSGKVIRPVSTEPEKGANKNCPFCGGSGWQPQDTDDRSLVKRCRCYEEERRQRLYLGARIPKKFSNCRLDNFEVYEDTGNKKRLNHSLSQPHEVAKLFAKKYPAVSKGLFFMGAYIVTMPLLVREIFS